MRIVFYNYRKANNFLYLRENWRVQIDYKKPSCRVFNMLVEGFNIPAEMFGIYLKLSSSPQVIYQNILISLHRALYLLFICHQMLCDSNKRRGWVCIWTAVGSPATFKEELLTPRESLIKAGWCNTPFCLVGGG